MKEEKVYKKPYNVRTKQYIKHTTTNIFSYTISGARRKPLLPVVRGEGKEGTAEKSLSRSRCAVADIALCNTWEWFITLTLDGKKVERCDYDKASKKVSNWLKNMRKICGADMKYITVAELHEKGGFHFHGLFSGVGGLTFTDSGKRSRKGLTVYNVQKYRWGWSTATKVQDTEQASKYLLKYINKELVAVTFNKKRYWRTKNCALPKEQTQFLEGEGVALLKDTLEDIFTYRTRLCKEFAEGQGVSVDIYQYDNIKPY